jgi:hypothetical protein
MCRLAKSYVDEPAITKLCRAEGFGWLPSALPSTRSEGIK